jgi:hypothetical protein
MNKNLLTILLLLLVGVIVFFVIYESSSSRVENRSENQFEYSTDEFEDVAGSLIKYKEIRQIKLSGDPKAIGWFNKQIYLLEGSQLKVISEKGTLLKAIGLTESANCLQVMDDGMILIAYKSRFGIFNSDLEMMLESESENEKAIFTSITRLDKEIFVADAGNRKVHRFSMDGKKLSDFEGVSGAESLHGFIIPSPYFDMGVNHENELWVVNPGMHTFQNYSPEGDLIRFWRKSSVEIDGFSGCCNPAHFTFLYDGSIITSEKGMPRIKVLNPDGELLAVVAPPEKFDGDQAPDVIADRLGNVYALDYDKKMVRIFMKMNKD